MKPGSQPTSRQKAVVDYLGLDNGTIFADLIGESWDPTIGTCFDYLVDFYSNSENYSNVNPAASEAGADGSITGVISMTYTDPDDGTSSECHQCGPLRTDPQ